MSEDLNLAEVPAPEQAETASLEPALVETPEQTEAPKTFTQEELDAIVSKRLAREQRKWERDNRQDTQPVKPAPSQEQFESPEAYTEALAEKKALEIIEQREQQRKQKEVLSAYHDREEIAREKYEDFEQVAYNPKLPITTDMAEVIQESEVGADIAYYLGSNPLEADRIARLSPRMQAKELGLLEAKISSSPPAVKKTTSAPAPIKPVNGASSGPIVYDTTDPRSAKTMSPTEWINAERERQRKKLEAGNR